MQQLFSHQSATGTMIMGMLYLAFSIPTAIHVLLRKVDERAAIGWIGLVVLTPFLGSVLYWMFGINRIKARAKQSRLNKNKTELFPEKPSDSVTIFAGKWQTLIRSGYAIHDSSYLPNNHVVPLINGDMAYPQMLKAIAEAKRDIILLSYIFDYDKTGREFVEALGDARSKNVNVFVLIDHNFWNQSFRITERELRKRNIVTARFLPFSPRFINLRNHRKILCIDGQVAFIGGMNIRQANRVAEKPSKPIQDIHFEIKGPVIDQISKTFSEDWEFATHKALNLSRWSGFCDGQVTCRILPDGPDENYQKLVWTLLAAINTAEYNIRIMTPYFIPDRTLICALQAASLRGVVVEIIVPEISNIPFFNWAMLANFDEYLKFDLKIYLCPPPFEHSKLFLVDDGWSFIGSANWDTRSLALNFEVNLECFDDELNKQLTVFFNHKKLNSKSVSKTVINQLSPYIQARNNFFRLLSPYL